MEFLESNLDHYAAAYKIAQEKYEKHRRDREWAETVFPIAVVDQLKKTRSRNADCTFRSLGIGSGSGEYETLLLRELAVHFPLIDHVVVEPSHDHVSHYRSAIEASSTTSGITFEWREETFDDYVKFRQHAARHGDVTGSNAQFDFVMPLHCLYYARDAAEAVRFLYDCVAPGGVLMIEMGVEETTQGPLLFRDFPELHSMFSAMRWVTLPEVKSALREAGIAFTTLIKPFSLDIASIFDATSRDGNLLLDFLTHVVEFRRTASPDLVERVLTFFRSKTQPSPLGAADTGTDDNRDAPGSDGDGKQFIFNKRWEVLIIKK